MTKPKPAMLSWSSAVITLMYSCSLCGLEKVLCSVPAREGEEILEWMDKTIRLLARDHQLRSPDCHPVSLKDVMIPVDGAEKIGGPTIQ